MQDIGKKIFSQDNHNKLVLGLTKELSAIYIYNYYLQENSIIVLTSTIYEANKLYNDLLFYTKNVLFFPMDDFLSSEALSISPELETERINTLKELVINNKQIVVTNLMGYLRFLPSMEIFDNSTIKLKQSISINRDILVNKLYSMGYQRESIVSQTGEMAVRGYVIDVFPLGEENPIRIEFFGDEIESIRYFLPENQRSIKEVNNISIYPNSEFITENYIEDILHKQKYLPKYLKKIASISDYLYKKNIVYIDYNTISTNNIQLNEQMHEYKNDSHDDIDDYMHNFNSIAANKELYINYLDDEIEDKKLTKLIFSSSQIENYNGNIPLLIKNLQKYLNIKKTVALFLKKETIKKILKYDLLENYIYTTKDKLFTNKINIISEELNKGFIIDNFVIIGENDVYNIKEQPKSFKNHYKYGTKIKNINHLNVGDYVVHNLHGIGIYKGLKTINKNDIYKDYLQIDYLNADKLYIPVEKIDLISKYSSKEGVRPKLNKLGSSDWEKTKLRIKKRLEDIADKLIKISAERQLKQGFNFSKDSEDQLLFENEFSYNLTTDQVISTNQIKIDMERSVPMDRLLCGDVGYGKTEVAFRAAFKAIDNNKQVAYLCPTTILSNQQYENALERFKNYPINIALLNRFTSLKQTKIILTKLKEGKIDLLIGTHRMLSKDVIYKDLGLLIIDEEQRFGVNHKEKIKEYKANIDILTLSATPIPRTLQMSIVGLRDLSLIETPPVDRYPVQTYVINYNRQILKDAIYKELSRNGQVFVLYNKIEYIQNRVDEIKRLVPEANIGFAHGQMSKREIEDKMLAFINGNLDVLVCTTIIETGIDIPNANTLIIIDANNFGLSQLYQIRGRVGRSNKIAYCYLMYNSNQVLSEVAVKRLQTIKEFTELGSGFKIAMRDLAIRGAGDILGKEQAGFIDSVGIELYLQMLNEEVDRLKGIKKNEEIHEKPVVEIETSIKDNYVSEDDVKIEIHNIINTINDQDSLLNVKTEIEDRFGRLDEKLILYMYSEWLEKIINNFEIDDFKQSNTYIELIMSKKISQRVNGDKLFNIAYDISRNFKFTYKNERIIINLNFNNLQKHFVYYLLELFLKMEDIVNK